ncbi:MAG: recombination mediator RecR [Candidatus Calescibacterium sp.]|nr:recombination mediator RecR [Candidatus Calescibacterium sp.]MCX7972237.1 recombination mediator RecR [bacterium]MDW8195162.1 recombination mediator RecR [Candidatus Calescibacterium sp.]
MLYKYPEISKVIEVFQKLPLVGPKTSEKIAFFLVQADQTLINEIIGSIRELRSNIKKCSNCFGITSVERDPCSICIDNNREPILCIVEDFKDQILIESAQNFNGKYHILEGLINPIEGKTPEKLRIKELIDRVHQENVKEILFAIPSSIEGDITVEYIVSKLKQRKSLVFSRLAVGVPAGSHLEDIDKITLINALKNRKRID